jgi:probable HAF family extracellular repeat protein
LKSLRLSRSFAHRSAGAQYEVGDLGPFAGNHNLVHGINNVGDMVGAAINPATTSIEACVRSSEATTLLGTLGGSFSVARAINNHREIVGGSLLAKDQTFHAALFRDGTVLDLNDLVPRSSGWELVQAIAINDLGQIIGIGSRLGEDRIFMLTPCGART